MKASLQRYAICSVLFITLALGGAWSAARFAAPSPALAFNLTDDHGRHVTAATYQGTPVLLFFGFTGCSNICPVTLARLKETQTALADAKQPVKILFITLDPVHDTPAALARYLAPFQADIAGLTGNVDALDRIYADFKVYPGHGANSDHSGLVYLVDAAGTQRARFTASLPVADTVKLITNSLKQHKGNAA